MLNVGLLTNLLPTKWASDLTRIGIVLAALALGLLFLRMHWVQVGREQILKEGAAATVRYVTKVQKVVQQVKVPYTVTETKIETVYKDIEREVTNVPSRPNCNVTVGWMREHDALAAGQDRRDTGALDDATDTGIAEARALAPIAANYKAYFQIANDLTACRAAFTGLSKIKP